MGDNKRRTESDSSSWRHPTGSCLYLLYVLSINPLLLLLQKSDPKRDKRS